MSNTVAARGSSDAGPALPPSEDRGNLAADLATLGENVRDYRLLLNLAHELGEATSRAEANKLSDLECMLSAHASLWLRRTGHNPTEAQANELAREWVEEKANRAQELRDEAQLRDEAIGGTPNRVRLQQAARSAASDLGCLGAFGDAVNHELLTRMDQAARSCEAFLRTYREIGGARKGWA